MRSLGTYLLIFGVGSIILALLHMKPGVLQWLDSWGETEGFLIRGGIVVLGIIFYFSEKRKEITIDTLLKEELEQMNRQV